MGVAVITLRAMTYEDVTAVASLEGEYRIRPWSRGVIEDELGQANRRYFVAAEESIVGYGGLMVVGDEAHITNLFVLPSYRERGLGRRIAMRLLRAAAEAGAARVTLEVRRSNHVARALYVSLGFEHEGVRPAYYGDDDAIIMWARHIDLTDDPETIA